MDPRATTWSGLLAVWSDFARSAGALPKTGNLGLLRRSVPAIIGLQALAHALEHMDCLPGDEYRAGQDRAALIARTLRAEIESIWRPDAMPQEIAHVVAEAEKALRATHEAGYEYVPESDPFQMPVGSEPLRDWRERRRFQGTMVAAPVSKRVRAGLPVLFVGPAYGRPLAKEELLDLGALLPGCLWGRVRRMRQVYETSNSRGTFQVAATQGKAGVGAEILIPIDDSAGADRDSCQVHVSREGTSEVVNTRGSL
ncbi:MAG: hypothetical protein KF691_05140 [Phycisphaeraceae bacterium]|nr:hypothetical protein [Phycisphaeraceae bacterium]